MCSWSTVVKALGVAQLKSHAASIAIWEKRKDLPAQWGGDGNMFYHLTYKNVQAKMTPKHDEL